MIRVNTQNDSVLIRPFDKSAMTDAARLFSSGSDIRYATGLDKSVTVPELEFLFDNIDNDENSFTAGIYIKTPDGEADHCINASNGSGSQSIDAPNGSGGRSINAPNESDCRSKSSLQFAGMCSGILSRNTIWIKQLSILPEYRRKGIGSSAAVLVMEYLKSSHGASEAFISVLEENTAGLEFWNGLGFFEITRFRKILFAEKRPHYVIIMQKRL